MNEKPSFRELIQARQKQAELDPIVRTHKPNCICFEVCIPWLQAGATIADFIRYVKHKNENRNTINESGGEPADAQIDSGS